MINGNQETQPMGDATDLRLKVLAAVGMAEAADEPLDPESLSQETGTSVSELAVELEQLDRMRLILVGPEEGDPPLLMTAGQQFLAASGDVPGRALDFLPTVVDDLPARVALFDAGVFLVDEFRFQHLKGDPVEHARDLVPPAFSGAVNAALALELFAASVALMVRLGDEAPAGCVAEEILAVRLIEIAEGELESRHDVGALSEPERSASLNALRGIFELFEDDDVLNLFEMQEPADAALAGHDPVNLQMGVADQRVESWFEPFAGTVATGYLTAG